MVCFAHGAGVEHAHHPGLLVAGHVGVAMENKAGFGRRRGHRFVAKEKGVTLALEQEGIRGEPPWVTVAADGMHGRSDDAQGLKNAGGADITKVPDFVRSGQSRNECLRQVVVCVGNDGNAHTAIVKPARSARKPRILRINCVHVEIRQPATA